MENENETIYCVHGDYRRFKKHDKHINSKINKINEKKKIILRIFMMYSPNNPLSTRTNWF